MQPPVLLFPVRRLTSAPHGLGTQNHVTRGVRSSLSVPSCTTTCAASPTSPRPTSGLAASLPRPQVSLTPATFPVPLDVFWLPSCKPQLDLRPQLSLHQSRHHWPPLSGHRAGCPAWASQPGFPSWHLLPGLSPARSPAAQPDPCRSLSLQASSASACSAAQTSPVSPCFSVLLCSLIQRPAPCTQRPQPGTCPTHSAQMTVTGHPAPLCHVTPLCPGPSLQLSRRRGPFLAWHMRPIVVQNQGSAGVFWKGPGEPFQFCRPYVLCHNSALLLQQEDRRRWHGDKRAWLEASETSIEHSGSSQIRPQVAVCHLPPPHCCCPNPPPRLWFPIPASPGKPAGP